MGWLTDIFKDVPLSFEFRLERPREIDYLSTWSIGGVERYSLEPKSREYLIKKNLISWPVFWQSRVAS